MTDIRWGMIGVGAVAERKSGPAFANAVGGRLVAVAARRPEAAADYADRHGIGRVYATPAALIESAEVDAVYIATPPSSHAALGELVARAGKPCCIEKPMSVRLHEAEALVLAFERAGLPLFVSYYRRSLPRFAYVRDLLREGRLGSPTSIEWRLARPASAGTGNAWRLDPREAPGGLFEDLACHGLDLFDDLLGAITAVEDAHCSTHAPGAVPDRVEARWRHGAGIAGSGRWAFDAKERVDRVRIACAHGSIAFSVFDEQPIEVASDGTCESVFIANPVPIQLPHVANLNLALRAGIAHPSTGRTALRTAIVSEAILHGPQAGLRHHHGGDA
ncbi:MAG: Gfo/Idh/MocA family oxidoreductase [Xanthomonadales bacterium]|nr:Gfo/Idh/MocA family oxidoreductase [Xanthomonadales bacterium]